MESGPWTGEGGNAPEIGNTLVLEGGCENAGVLRKSGAWGDLELLQALGAARKDAEFGWEAEVRSLKGKTRTLKCWNARKTLWKEMGEG